MEQCNLYSHSTMRDHFKVVYIKTLKEMEPIPHLWEENGTCWFPSKKREISLYQCNASKAPEKDKWPSYSCIVKVTGLLDWQRANESANLLCNKATSSEDDDSDGAINKKRIRKPNTKFSDYVYNISEDSGKQALTSNSLGTHSKAYVSALDSPDMSENEERSPITHDEETADNTTLTSSNVLDIASSKDLEELTVKVNSVLTHLEDQKEVLIKYFDEKFAGMACLLENIQNIMTKKGGVGEIGEEDGGMLNNILPLTSTIDVQKLEKLLKNEEERKALILHLRKIVGTGFPWRQASYKLSSVMFTKELLIQYSWTGASCTKILKEPFNKLDNILGVFFQVVRFSDNSFTHAHREIFFRDGILKHSQSRLHPKKKNKENEPNAEILDGAEMGGGELNEKGDEPQIMDENAIIPEIVFSGDDIEVSD